MPPEYADDIRDSQFAFEKAMSKMTKVYYHASPQSFCDLFQLVMSLMSYAPIVVGF